MRRQKNGTLASASKRDDGKISIWSYNQSTNQYEIKQTIGLDNYYVSSMALSEDGETLIAQFANKNYSPTDPIGVLNIWFFNPATEKYVLKQSISLTSATYTKGIAIRSKDFFVTTNAYQQMALGKMY